MSEKNFIERLRSNPHPVVVDFWAPWCAPCRAIGPVVEKLGEEYVGRVDLWKVNADEQPNLLRSLHIYGIPTLIAFHDGEEVGRRTGAASQSVLSGLFDTALSGTKPQHDNPEIGDRLLRLGAGMALVSLAVLSGLAGSHWIIAGLGGLILFSAVYDRCPVYKAVSGRLKELFQRKPTSSSNN